MNAAQYLSIALYIAVFSVTPGPNNLMLLSSGARFGVRRSVPHMLGISLGSALMVLLTGLGLVGMFVRYPILQQALRWVGLGYLLWLAWQMTRSPAPASSRPAAADKTAHTTSATQADPQSHPLGFMGAAAFQWINPKLWMGALGLFTAYLPVNPGNRAVILVSILFAFINIPCVSIWAAAGQQLQHLLQKPKTLLLFNWSMAVLLVASMLPALVLQH